MNIFDILDDNDLKIISGIHKKDEKLFDLGVKLLKFSHGSFPLGKKLSHKNVSQPVERCLLGLYVQAFRLFRSIIILSKCGSNLEVPILLRSLLDNVPKSYIESTKQKQIQLL